MNYVLGHFETRQNNLFQPTFAQEYELARRIGDRRFGSECKHEKTKNGKCLNCLRIVIAKKQKTNGQS